MKIEMMHCRWTLTVEEIMIFRSTIMEKVNIQQSCSVKQRNKNIFSCLVKTRMMMLFLTNNAAAQTHTWLNLLSTLNRVLIQGLRQIYSQIQCSA